MVMGKMRRLRRIASLVSDLNDLQIDAHLGELVDEMDKDLLITLSINHIVRPTAVHNIKT